MSAKKLVSLIFLTAVFACSFTFPAYGETKNVIKNPGFEEISQGAPTNWRTYEGGLSGVSSGAVETAVHTGKVSYKIGNSSENDTMVVQNVNVESDKIYKVSYWLKAEDIEKQSGSANITLYYGSNNTECKGIITSPEHKDTANKWQLNEFYIKTLNISEPLTVALRLGGQGTPNKGNAYFDDVSMAVVDSAEGADVMSFYVPSANPNPNPDTTQASTTDPKPFNFTIPLLIILGVAVLGLLVFVELKLSKRSQKNNNENTEETSDKTDSDEVNDDDDDDDDEDD